MKNNETQSDSIKEPMDVNATQSKRNPFLKPAFLSGTVTGLTLGGLLYYATTRDFFATLIFVSILIIFNIVLALFITSKINRNK